jgi:hypothetical protein
MGVETEYWGKPTGFQRITSLSGATALTVPAGSSIAVIGCTTQNVRWRDDGTSPTATVGMLIRTTDQPFIYRGDLGRLKFIEAAASASLEVAYYGNAQ